MSLLTVVGAGLLGAILMLITIILGVLCYICRERREQEERRDKERDILRRRSSANIRGQK